MTYFRILLVLVFVGLVAGLFVFAYRLALHTEQEGLHRMARSHAGLIISFRNFYSSYRDWVVVGATPEGMRAAGFRPVGRDLPKPPVRSHEIGLAQFCRKLGGVRYAPLPPPAALNGEKMP